MSSLIARCKTIAGVTGLVLTHACVSSLCVFGCLVGGASSAIAAPPKEGAKDAEALELAKKAIYTDYLGTKFADAEKKLKQAVALCEPNDACSAKVRAQLLCHLGVVYIGGMNDVAQGKAQFAAALKLDASIAPDADLLSPEIEAAFAESKKGGGGPAPKNQPPPPPKPPQPAAGATGDLVHTTINEQATLTPLPVYAEMPAATNAARMQVFFKPFGATEWKATEMKPMGKGYGAEIPCAEVGSAQGELAYYIQAFDADKNLVSWSGSRSAPNKVAIRLTLTGEAPHLPGQAPPARCPDVGDCPPEFPGCHGKKTDEPPPCEPGAECNQPKPEGKKNWISLAVQQDFLAFSGNKSTCAGPPASDYTCFDTSSNYYGGIPFAMSGDEIKGGLGVATTRILAGYNRVIGHFTIGARLGVALRGGPKSPNGRGFLPFHGEARVAYWFGADPFARKSVRPYVVLGGGMAQVDSSVGVVIYNNAQDYVSDTRTHLDAWKKAGTGFITGGVGLLVPVSARQGPLVELKYMQLLGAFAPALSMQLGYAFGL